MRILLSEAEQEMLADSHLSHAAKLAYVLGLRPYVDAKSRIVGDKRRVSSQSIREAIEFLPDPGSHLRPFRPSRDQVKRILQRLEQVGAIKPLDKTRRTSPIRVLLPLMEVRSQEERPRSAQVGAPKTNGATPPDKQKGAPKERPSRNAHHRGVGERDSYESQASPRAREWGELIEIGQTLAEQQADKLDCEKQQAARSIASWISTYGQAAVTDGLNDLANSNEAIRESWFKAAKSYIRAAAQGGGSSRRPKAVTQADEHEFNDDQTPEGFE